MPRKKSAAPKTAAKKPRAKAAPKTGAEAVKKSSEYLIVGVGASAGGVEAFGALLRQIPADAPLAFVLISHLDPHHESILAELLGNQTAMPVVQVKDDMPVECNRVYVIPPNQEMVIGQGHLKLRPRAEGPSRYMPIDTFLRSLADDQRAKSIGVVLSGTASDGTLGLKAIKAEGGITFAQDQTAKFDSMPRTAIAAGAVDFVLPPDGIARELIRLATHPYLWPADAAGAFAEEGPLGRIMDLVRKTNGVDLSQYKQPTVLRRTMRRMALHKIDQPQAYLDYLEKHTDELQGLCNDLLITVTEFFRDPGTFDALNDLVFPRIVKDRAESDPIRIWVPACSTGEEVYSIAICLIEYLESADRRVDLQLFGTDVSETCINKARTGIYPKAIASVIAPERLRRFFIQADSGYQIGRRIRDCCVFSVQNILRDPPLSRMDLVSCRNLLIYLRPPAQNRVAAFLHYALKPSGCLVLGSSESLGPMGKYFTTLDRHHKIYGRNVAGGDPPALDLPPGLSPLGLKGVPPFGMGSDGAGAPEFTGLLERYVDRHLAEYYPRAIIADNELRILDVRGNLRALFQAPPVAKMPLFDALRKELVEPLRAAVLEARSDQMPVQRQSLSFRDDGEALLVDCRVLPISIPQRPDHFLLMFEDLRAATPSNGGKRGGAAESSQNVERLQRKLESNRQYVQTVIEELRSANEEIQSTNEELQSTNEELQTAKEELQASNEELRTINDEMQSRNTELSRAHNDLMNLLSSMNVPALMLDSELRIRRFTPVSEKILHLIASDIGRPIADLKLRINVPDLEEVLHNVIATPTVYEREVRDEEGRWYAMRIRPYRTIENRIEGAVLQLVDIDEVKRGNESLKRERDYSDAVFNTVRAPLAVLHKRELVRVGNQAFYENFGVTAEGAANRSIFEIAQGCLNTPELRTLLDRAAEPGRERQEIEIECELKNQGVRVLVVNARGVLAEEEPGLILLAFEDITERKREAEARYRRLFEAARDGIIIADAETEVIVDANPFVKQLFGYERQEVVGKKLSDLEGLAEVRDLKTSVARIREQGVVRFPDVPIKTKDGRLIQSEIIGNIYPEKKSRVIQFNIRDISERRKFFRQIQESQKLESLGLLAGGIAHDFNNLLTGIIGNVSLALADAQPDARSRSYLRDAISAGEQASQLTRQMLAYAGRGSMVTEPVDISDLIREIQPLIQSSIPKNADIHLDLLEHPPAVKADRAKIQQLIMNLVINGAEAIPEGRSGGVFVRTAEREITAHDAASDFAADFAGEFGNDELQPGPYLMIEVRDTGVGMDEATKANIFDPFFTTKFTGRGLGLAAAMGIVKSHRGALHVLSTPGEGSTFTVWLPVVPAKASQRKEPPKELSRGAGTILVIEDDAIVRQFTERALTSFGYKVLSAGNGEAGMKLFGEHRGGISLVILDLTMPAKNGEETLKELKKIGDHIPVILSSGYDQIEAMRRFGESDLAGFLQKPYTVQRLLERVHAALA